MNNPRVCYHLPGLFEFYELYKAFLPLFLSIVNIFMTGVKSVQFTVLLPIAFGAAEGLVLAKIIPVKF